MNKSTPLIAILFGLVGAALLFTKSSQAPAFYVGSFTSQWVPPIFLFVGVLLPTALLRFRLDRFFTRHRVVWGLVFGALIGGALGVYVAVRYVVEQPNRTVVNWLIVIVGTIIYALANGALLYWLWTVRQETPAEN